MDLFNYKRRETIVVRVGNTPLGGENPVRLQSMTDTSTMDTQASAAQVLRIAQSGADYVRLTTQGTREAENLRLIKAEVRKTCQVPLIADVHFNPTVAETAALYADKVRINPGNYVDAARTFKHLEYTDEEYKKEIEKIEKRLVPFLRICKERRTAIRIGVNHGSLSDRIMSRYGDTEAGIVESCMEFLRICVKERFTDVVVSIKASNTAVMVRSVRRLVATMEEEGMKFPLHLGVTEAGEGEDGRIKSAAGIGALLADGIGDTIRVSLSEAPEKEIPVARKLADYISNRAKAPTIAAKQAPQFNYISPERRKTRPVREIGGDNSPVVVAFRPESPLRHPDNADVMPDYIYCGGNLPAPDERNGNYIVDFNVYKEEENTFPAFLPRFLPFMGMSRAPLKFLFLSYADYGDEIRACLRTHPEVVVISQSNHPNRLGEHRALVHQLMNDGLQNPVIFHYHYSHSQEEKEDFQIEAAADAGPLLFDGLCDGICLSNQGTLSTSVVESTAFAILQATRLRVTKTEYISCPGCGRTLYDLQGTIARIKAATAHLKGLKIAIMGCIVNGPGEMADADYGYVGAARGKVSLYRKKTCIERNIPEHLAVDKLLHLIETDHKRIIKASYNETNTIHL